MAAVETIEEKILEHRDTRHHLATIVVRLTDQTGRHTHLTTSYAIRRCD